MNIRHGLLITLLAWCASIMAMPTGGFAQATPPPREVPAQTPALPPTGTPGEGLEQVDVPDAAVPPAAPRGLHPTMTPVDWLVLIVPILVVSVVALKTRRHVKSVADFMSASRVAGRYLVATAQGEASYGATNVVAQLEQFLIGGFMWAWWLQVNNVVWLFILLSGFIIYRYRESRVMTLAQFFEIRYSRAFRVFAGSLAFLSGLLAYGIYPAVGSRFFVYFCGFPEILPGTEIPTFLPVMILLMLPGILLTTMGGQLTLMVVDCLEGIISLVFYLCVAIALWVIFSWTDISAAMSDHLVQNPNQSLVNPFDNEKNTDFGFWFVMIMIFVNAYGWQSSQVGHGFRSAAINAHEQKMGAILGPWRNEVRTLMLTILGVCIFTYLHSAQGQAVMASLSDLDPAMSKQVRSPAALGQMLPPVIRGMFAAIMFFALVSTDCTMMHSWATIFVQDIIVPLRKTPLTQHAHVNLLRAAVVGVGLFALIFSYQLATVTYINMFLAIVSAVFAGAGACIIGGFYWRKGTTAAAWAAMLGAALVSLSGGALTQTWKAWTYPWLKANAPGAIESTDRILRGISDVVPNLGWHVSPDAFFFNGAWISLFAALTAILLYVGVTYLTYRRDFDLDRMLHRGKYAVEGEHKIVESTTKRRKLNFSLLVGITPEFTRTDKAISLSLFGYRIFWFMVFAVVTVWNLIPGQGWSESTWSSYWHYTAIWLPFVVATAMVIWFTWGGLRDIRQLFIRLRTVKRDEHDDGTVTHQREPT